MKKISNPQMDEQYDKEAWEGVRGRLAVLEQLQKYPIVQVACEKAGIGRSTYYKWRKIDKLFAEHADLALRAGVLFINDMAESKLIRKIQDGSNTAIIFWLKNHHKGYGDKIKHEHELVLPPEPLDPEKAEAIRNFINETGKSNLLKYQKENIAKQKKKDQTAN